MVIDINFLIFPFKCLNMRKEICIHFSIVNSQTFCYVAVTNQIDREKIEGLEKLGIEVIHFNVGCFIAIAIVVLVCSLECP